MKIIKLFGTPENEILFKFKCILNVLGKDYIQSLNWAISKENFVLNTFHSEVENFLEEKQLDNQKAIWMIGSEFYKKMINIGQTIWFTCIGFNKNLGIIEFNEEPISEGSPNHLQHPDALIEIRAIDGCYYEILTEDEEIVKKLQTIDGKIEIEEI